jgi:hypothetical protein
MRAPLELLNHSVEIRIPGAKAPRQPVPAALGDPLAVRDHFELPGLGRHKLGIQAEALLDEGHETRNLGLVVRSCRAVHDFDFHYRSHPSPTTQLAWSEDSGL